MPFVQVAMNDPAVVEQGAVRNGRYALCILNVEETKTKEKGKPQLLIEIGFEDQPSAMNMRHYIGLPSPGDEPKTSNFKTLLLKRFCALFQIPYDDRGFDTDSMLGARVTAEVTLSDPEEDSQRRTFNRLVVPNLPTEAGDNVGQRKSPTPPKS